MELWQPDCINGATPAKATKEPCMPIASININAVS
jgi:hypothetical protein